VIALAGVSERLSKLDLLVAALHAPLTLGGADEVFDRTSHPLVAIDLSVPRALDPSLAKWPGVTLKTVDDLGHLARRTTARRMAEVPRAAKIADDEAARVYQWIVARRFRRQAGS